MNDLRHLAAAAPVTRDYITLGGEIIIAMISALAVAVAAYFQFVLGPRLKAARVAAAKARDEAAAMRQEQQDEREKVTKTLAAVLHQVQNSHSTNLRDDLDRLHEEMVSGFSSVHHRVDSVVDRLDRHIDNRA